MVKGWRVARSSVLVCGLVPLQYLAGLRGLARVLHLVLHLVLRMVLRMALHLVCCRVSMVGPYCSGVLMAVGSGGGRGQWTQDMKRVAPLRACWYSPG